MGLMDGDLRCARVEAFSISLNRSYVFWQNQWFEYYVWLNINYILNLYSCQIKRRTKRTGIILAQGHFEGKAIFYAQHIEIQPTSAQPGTHYLGTETNW